MRAIELDNETKPLMPKSGQHSRGEATSNHDEASFEESKSLPGKSLLPKNSSPTGHFWRPF